MNTYVRKMNHLSLLLESPIYSTVHSPLFGLNHVQLTSYSTVMLNNFLTSYWVDLQCALNEIWCYFLCYKSLILLSRLYLKITVMPKKSETATSVILVLWENHVINIIVRSKFQLFYDIPNSTTHLHLAKENIWLLSIFVHDFAHYQRIMVRNK